jgi:hypothetical protein
MGGMIGQTFALKYPGVLRTLTLADTTSRYPAEALPTWQERIKTVETQGMEPLAQATLERWFTESFRKSQPGVVDGVRKLILTTPVAGYAGCCHAIPKINLTARLKEIQCPILVIVGADDPGTPVAMAKEIQDNAPGRRRRTSPISSNPRDSRGRCRSSSARADPGDAAVDELLRLLENRGAPFRLGRVERGFVLAPYLRGEHRVARALEAHPALRHARALHLLARSRAELDDDARDLGLRQHRGEGVDDGAAVGGELLVRHALQVHRAGLRQKRG